VSWLAFAVALWVGLGLELGLRDALRLGAGPVSPSFVVPITVWFVLNASSRRALWAALIAGAMLDLTAAMPRTDGGDALILGPRALGMLVAAPLRAHPPAVDHPGRGLGPRGRGDRGRRSGPLRRP